MNNKRAWWVIGAIVIVALVVYFAMNRSDNNESTENQVESQSEQNEKKDRGMVTDPASLKELVAMNTPMKCEYNDSESKTQGTMYVADKKVRGDYTIVTDAKTQNGHMILDGLTLHVWMDGEKDGFTMTISEETKAQAENQTVDPNKQMDFDCDSWSGDAAMFKLPANVEFKDFSAMMKAFESNE